MLECGIPPGAEVENLIEKRDDNPVLFDCEGIVPFYFFFPLLPNIFYL